MSTTRRGFVKATVGSVALASWGSGMPAFLQRAARAAPEIAAGDSNEDAPVLIVLQLSGGNDGLNTVVPFDNDVYGRSRRTLRLGRKQVIPLNSQLGLHGQMTGFHRLIDQGRLSVLQGVGYAHNDRSHDAAMRDWHTAKPGDSACQTGWIGRAADTVHQQDAESVPAALIGPINPPLVLNAEQSLVPSIRRLSDLKLQRGLVAERRASRAADQPPSDARDLAAYAADVRRAAIDLNRRVDTVLRDDRSTAEYPSFALAGHLRQVAQLIRARTGIRIFFVELGGGGIGGFDNHANQRDNHAALLRELSESVTAFVSDLQTAALLDRVMLMTFSEFGRTVSENGRRGTGHGAAAPMFLAGGRVRSGLLGDHPSLDDLEQDAPKPHTDFRSVYATLLRRWLGFDDRAILGGDHPLLDLITT